MPKKKRKRAFFPAGFTSKWLQRICQVSPQVSVDNARVLGSVLTTHIRVSIVHARKHKRLQCVGPKAREKVFLFHSLSLSLNFRASGTKGGGTREHKGLCLFPSLYFVNLSLKERVRVRKNDVTSFLSLLLRIKKNQRVKKKQDTTTTKGCKKGVPLLV